MAAPVITLKFDLYSDEAVGPLDSLLRHLRQYLLTIRRHCQSCNVMTLMFGAAAAVVAVLQYYLSGHSSRDIPSPSFIQPVAQGP